MEGNRRNHGGQRHGNRSGNRQSLGNPNDQRGDEGLVKAEKGRQQQGNHGSRQGDGGNRGRRGNRGLR